MDVKQVTYNVVNHNDLDRLIEKVYGLKEFSCVADQEWNNDSEHAFTVDRKPLDQWGQKKIDALSATGWETWVLSAVLQDLCNQHIIEPGEWLIEVCW